MTDPPDRRTDRTSIGREECPRAPERRTEVRRGTLVVRSDRSLRPRSRPRVEVTVPALRKVELSGSGDVVIDGGSGPLQLEVEGSGDVRWKGEATELRASIEGSGDVRLEGRAERLKVSVDEIEWAGESCGVIGTDQMLDWAQVVQEALIDSGAITVKGTWSTPP